MRSNTAFGSRCCTFGISYDVELDVVEELDFEPLELDLENLKLKDLLFCGFVNDILLLRSCYCRILSRWLRSGGREEELIYTQLQFCVKYVVNPVHSLRYCHFLLAEWEYVPTCRRSILPYQANANTLWAYHV